jgi:hypothetical protein
MNEVKKERVAEILQELLDRMTVCNSKNCMVCQRVKRQVEVLAADLGIEPDVIMPHTLKARGN